jgi:crotonobetainyl-CoA:carnitine CoA-transferase CaiB-like acyl-CoA transferase
LMLAVGSDAQFRALCEVLGCAAWAEDPRFANNPDRVLHRLSLHPLLQARIGAWQRLALLEALWQAQVPAGALHTVSEALATPEAESLQITDSVTGLRGLRSLAFTPPGGSRSLRVPPHLGEHSVEVLSELGYLPAEIATFLAAGVMGGGTLS